MKSADEYAEMATHRAEQALQEEFSYRQDRGMRESQMWATLALAAATLEAAEANYEAHKRRLLEALNEEAEDPGEADIDAFMGAIENPDADCSALMERPK